VINSHTKLQPSLAAQPGKCIKTLLLRFNARPHKPQPKGLTSECFSWWCFSSLAVQKRIGHSPQAYNFKPSWRRKCTFRLAERWNFFPQIWHVNQVPSSCVFNRCTTSCLRHRKRSEQCLHEYLFSPVWIRTCWFSSRLFMNPFPQYGQRHGLSFEWTCNLCANNSLVWAKLLPHIGHIKGFSPVCTRMCSFRVCDKRNARSHTEHFSGRSSVCSLTCRCRWCDTLNDLSQYGHAYGFNPVWTLICLFRCADCVNVLLHKWQQNGRALLCVR